ncbi:hypothetical protein ACIBEJ_35990 [Nonomuraea sp. NPDC050790]|uniref:hypothetical protein n=1 Tax=Nonomuraea sp. NPDC050790 TaxID=3364371 RepID=UPI0037A4C215
MDNYYAIVGAARNDPADVIKKKITNELRQWQKRTNSSDLSKRQEAERKRDLLSKAGEVLLDDARRQAYDRQLDAFLASGGGSQAPVVAPSAGGDWLDQARGYLAVGDYNSAAYCAREARNTLGASAEVWSLLARANAGLGNLSDALYEAQQATSLDPASPDRQLELGGVYEELEQWDRALACYEQVNRLSGDSEEADLGIASALANQGRFAEAIPVLEKLHVHGSNQRMAAYYLADVLLAHAETIPVVKEDDGYFITSAEEIAQIRRVLYRVRMLSDDQEIMMRLADQEQYLAAMETKHLFGVTGWKITKTVILWAVIAFVITGFMSNLGTGGFFLGLLVGGGLAWLRVHLQIRNHYLPQWRINAKIKRGR